MGTNKIVHTEIKNFFTDEECSELIKDVIKFSKAGVGNRDGTSKIDENYRKTLQSKEINNHERWQSIILKKLQDKTDIPIVSMPELLVLKYLKGFKFDKHRDRGPQYEDRIYTKIIQLSDSNKYENGDLLINNNLATKEKGSLIFFNSGILHSVSEITSGERYSAVTWIRRRELQTKTNLL